MYNKAFIFILNIAAFRLYMLIEKFVRLKLLFEFKMLSKIRYSEKLDK